MNKKDYILAAINEYNLMMHELNPIINKIDGKERLVELGRSLSYFYNCDYDLKNLYNEFFYCKTLIDIKDLEVRGYFLNIKTLLFVASLFDDINSFNNFDRIKYNLKWCCENTHKAMLNFNEVISKLKESKKYGKHILDLGEEILLKYEDLKLPLYLNDLIALKTDINNFYNHLNGPNDEIPKELKIANNFINEAMKNLNNNIL